MRQRCRTYTRVSGNLQGCCQQTRFRATLVTPSAGSPAGHCGAGIRIPNFDPVVIWPDAAAERDIPSSANENGHAVVRLLSDDALSPLV